MIKSPFFFWFSNALTPLLTFFIISFPFWLSIKHPNITAYILIAIYIFFFTKAIELSYKIILAYKLIIQLKDKSFDNEIEQMNCPVTSHFIIMPNYKEPLHKLEESIQSFIQHDSKLYKKYLVLAFEDREEDARRKEKILKEKFKNDFADIVVSYHVMQPGEIVGKASNQAFAAKIVTQYCLDKKIKNTDALVTIVDADSILSNNYFSYLTFKYRSEGEEAKYHFYWAPVLLYNNFWKLTFFVRIQATLSSIGKLAVLENKEFLIHMSTYSTNLWLLEKIGYWDTDIIPEDWHVYLQAFFTFGKRIRTIPMYTLVSVDAIEAPTVKQVIANRYDQERRWAWGVTDVGYSLRKCFITPHISWKDKLEKVLFLIVNHVRWPTTFFLISLAAYIPRFINPYYEKTVLNLMLPKVASFFLTVSTLFLILYFFIDVKLRKELKIETPIHMYPLLIVQWIFMPVVSFFFSALPALDAHTRLILGKHIEYKVAQKV